MLGMCAGCNCVGAQRNEGNSIKVVGETASSCAVCAKALPARKGAPVKVLAGGKHHGRYMEPKKVKLHQKPALSCRHGEALTWTNTYSCPIEFIQPIFR
jgi:hypothetical protein